MRSANPEGLILVTGASGHIGTEVCRVLRTAERKILPVDLNPAPSADVIACDLHQERDVSRLFETYPIRIVIHLAGILLGAFRADPLTGADVNLSASLQLMRQAVTAHVQRFIFASSIAVYGSSPTDRPVTESDPAAPDEPYGGSKRAIELVGETLHSLRAIEFVSLRIARVIGPGVKKTSSPWRAQIFESLPGGSIRMPYAPEAELSLVHVEDVARMLLTLADSTKIGSLVYNTPVEIWEARQLKEVIEKVTGAQIELGENGVHGGPTCDGSRFAREFRFELRGLRERLSDHRRAAESVRR